jgi:hypothetical protein
LPSQSQPKRLTWLLVHSNKNIACSEFGNGVQFWVSCQERSALRLIADHQKGHFGVSFKRQRRTRNNDFRTVIAAHRIEGNSYPFRGHLSRYRFHQVSRFRHRLS